MLAVMQSSRESVCPIHSLPPLYTLQCGRTTPLLVGASKKQPVMKIQWAYNQGLRHFGENYVSYLLVN